MFPDILKRDKCYSACQLLQEFHFRQRSRLSPDRAQQVQRLNVLCTGTVTHELTFNFHISETRLYILMKLLHVQLNKW